MYDISRDYKYKKNNIKNKIYKNITCDKKTEQIKLLQEPPITPVPVGGHDLPLLAYAYDALEPYIIQRTMIVHHDVLHRGYVEKLNNTELLIKAAREKKDYKTINALERDLAYYGAAHYLHTLFWEIMYPGLNKEPSSALRKQLEADYGNFQDFKKQFSEVALAVEMAGWAILAWCPRSQRTCILMTQSHPNLTQWESIPLLVLDMAEHAYFLQYSYRKEEYIDNWWEIINWPEVEKRWLKAQTIRWHPW